MNLYYTILYYTITSQHYSCASSSIDFSFLFVLFYSGLSCPALSCPLLAKEGEGFDLSNIGLFISLSFLDDQILLHSIGYRVKNGVR